MDAATAVGPRAFLASLLRTAASARSRAEFPASMSTQLSLGSLSWYWPNWRENDIPRSSRPSDESNAASRLVRALRAASHASDCSSGHKTKASSSLATGRLRSQTR